MSCCFGGFPGTHLSTVGPCPLTFRSKTHLAYRLIAPVTVCRRTFSSPTVAMGNIASIWSCWNSRLAICQRKWRLTTENLHLYQSMFLLNVAMHTARSGAILKGISTSRASGRRRQSGTYFEPSCCRKLCRWGEPRASSRLRARTHQRRNPTDDRASHTAPCRHTLRREAICLINACRPARFPGRRTRSVPYRAECVGTR